MSKSITIREIINRLENIESHYQDNEIKFNEFELKYSYGILNIQLTAQKSVDNIEINKKTTQN